MAFFMKMYGWSYPFSFDINGQLPYLPEGEHLDFEATQDASKTGAGQGLPGDGGGGRRATLRFRSVKELEGFVAAKEKELAYVEKQLAAMPALQDPAWGAYVVQLDDETPVPVDEALEGPDEFLRHTLIPHLRAQVQSLKARAARTKVLEQKHEELRRMCERQAELPAVVQCLQQRQAWLIPVCPVWKEVETEIKQAQKEILDPEAVARLHKKKEKARLEYEAVLKQEFSP